MMAGRRCLSFSSMASTVLLMASTEIDVLRGDTAHFHRAFHRRNQARPPLIGVLLGPARTRVLQRILPFAKD